MSASLLVYDGTTIGWVLGTVIPSILGFATYVCKLILDVKQKGWKNLNQEDWKQIGESIEKEFALVYNAVNKDHYYCEHCQKQCSGMQDRVHKLGEQISQSKDSLLKQTKDQVEKNIVLEKDNKLQKMLFKGQNS
ncbi:hypothetical protein [Candidatus Mycoplasma haematominutum]|uniref:Transmembrane protein n=1 Tax=Candidatus Mycoplasma haematominutum 'Birmingham 1' TaxID=1116213 RepID=G8C2J8_9MOLU|nr:hypothetical protein [Candidatus Mycoplasma haematominutum]CCE66546.1 hypothetical protein (homolog to MSU_0034) [Candidatus Mycoplasma haematominutum 'Birmingham 1']